MAGVRTWDGGGTDNNWSTAANWDAAIANNDTLTFAGTTRLTSNNDLTTTSPFKFTFAPGAGAFVIGGTSILMSGNVDNNGTDSTIQTINLNMALNGNRQFNANGTATVIINGIVTDNGTRSLTINGASGDTGTIVLAGNNAYDGPTSVSHGVLNIRNANALGATSAGTTVAAGAALEIQGGISVAAEPLTLDGTGISNQGGLRNISGNNQWSGPITINSTTRIQSDSGTLTVDVASGNAITGSNDSLEFGGTGNVAVKDAIATGSGTLTKDGSGTLTLSGANTYSGTTTVNAGSLVVAANAPSGAAGSLGNATSAVIVGNSSGSSDASLLTAGAVTVSRTITVQSGNSGVSTIGGSTDNTSTFSGAISLNKNASINQATTTGANTLTISGGISAGSTGTKTVTFDNIGAVAVTGTGISDGSGVIALAKQGAGTLTLTTANTYSGGTTLTSGTIRLGAANVIPNTGTFTFNGTGSATFDPNSLSETIGPLSLAGSGTMTILLNADGTQQNVTFTSASRTAGSLLISNWTTTAADQVLISGGSPSQDFLNNVQFLVSGNLIQGAYWRGDLGGALVPIPEPVNLALGGFAAGCLVVLGSRHVLRPTPPRPAPRQSFPPTPTHPPTTTIPPRLVRARAE